LDATQRNWDIYDKELFAVVHALETWRPYLVGSVHKTLINIDHNNLTYFKAAQKLNQQQARWMQELAEFDFELRHVPRKKHVPTDFLSRPFGENQGKDDNEDLVLLPPVRFASVNFPIELEARRHILQVYHDHPLAGHPGIANTIHLLSQTYQGKEMKEFAEEYV
jgi:RNase H-like domain found in reverse transcriptase/Integrase zinc binding domain